MDMNFAPSRFIVYTNEEVSSEVSLLKIFSIGSRQTSPALRATSPNLGEELRLPSSSDNPCVATMDGAKEMVTAERVLAGDDEPEGYRSWAKWRFSVGLSVAVWVKKATPGERVFSIDDEDEEDDAEVHDCFATS